jgi:thiol-disulfide isomerase/thioredoxin
MTTRRTWLASGLGAWLLAASARAAPSVAGHQPGTLDAETFAQIRARHAGRPLVVHLWGMTCGPCLSELPKWGELYRRRPGMNLVLIQVDQAPPRAGQQTLQAAGLRKAERWSAGSELDEFLRASIDPKWRGDMPRTLLISPGGEIGRIAGVADLAQVERWLDEVSGKRP